MEKMKRLLDLVVILLFLGLAFAPSINAVNNFIENNQEEIIIKIYGGIGCHFSVENNNNYTITGFYNITCLMGEIIERGTFKVYPNNIFGIDYWFMLRFPIRIFINVNIELIVENQTVAKSGYKIFIFWFLRN